MADVAAASIPRSADRGTDPSRTLLMCALVVSVALVPLLPPIAWKVKATLLTGLLLAAGFYVRGQRPGSFGRSAIDLPALAFLGAAVLSTVFSVEPLVSFFPSRFRGEGLIVSIAYVVAALAAARLARPDVERVAVALLACGAVVALIALPQFYGVDTLGALGFRSVPPLRLTGPDPVELRTDSIWLGLRAQGTLANPIFLGGYAALLLPVATAMAVLAKGRVAWAYTAASLTLYAALITSQTRSAWIGAAVAALVLILLVRTSPGALRRAASLVVGFALVTAVLILTRPSAALPQRASAALSGNDYSLRQKVYVWKHTLPLIAQRPLLGWGSSTLVGQFKDMGSPEYLSVFGTEQIVLIDTPHNELLHVAYNAGLLGLAAYLWVWAAALRGLWHRLRGRAPARHVESMPLPVAAGLAGSLVAYALWMQFAWTVIGPANVLWVMLGLAAGQAGGASTESAARWTVKVAGRRPTDSPSA